MRARRLRGSSAERARARPNKKRGGCFVLTRTTFIWYGECSLSMVPGLFLIVLIIASAVLFEQWCSAGREIYCDAGWQLASLASLRVDGYMWRLESGVVLAR